MSVFQLLQAVQNRSQETAAEIAAAEKGKTKKEDKNQNDLGAFLKKHLPVITPGDQDIGTEPLVLSGKLHFFGYSQVGSYTVRAENASVRKVFCDSQCPGGGKVVAVCASAGHGLFGSNLQGAGGLPFRSGMNIRKDAGQMAQRGRLGHFMLEKAVIHFKTADAQKGTVS